MAPQQWKRGNSEYSMINAENLIEYTRGSRAHMREAQQRTARDRAVGSSERARVCRATATFKFE
jgi:hypothetical protein